MSISSIAGHGSVGPGAETQAQYWADTGTAKPGEARPDQARDAATISTEAKMISLMDSFMGGAGADGKITYEEIQNWQDANLGKAQQILRETVRDLGIDSKGRIQIDISPSGDLIVTGNMPKENRQRLQETLHNDREFRFAYGAASSAATILKAGEAASVFHKAYAEDPMAAVARFRWLFDKNWGFSLFFERDKVEFEVVG